MRRIWSLFACALVFIQAVLGTRQDTIKPPQVFVDIEQLARLHPTWQLAARLESEGVGRVLAFEIGSLFLVPVPLNFALPDETGLRSWEREAKERLQKEADALSQRLSQKAPLPVIALPHRPFSDPMERWKWLTERLAEQAQERAKLRLRLFFTDRLSQTEREQLRRRMAELDAQLQPPQLPEPKLPIAIAPEPEPLPLKAESLTDVTTLVSLISPLPSILPTGQEWGLGISILPTVRFNFAVVLRRVARETAKAFAQANGKRKGVVPVFSPNPNLPDATAGFLQEWQRWLAETFTIRGF